MTLPGLTYIQDFIGIETHDALVAAIDAQPWKTNIGRRVQQYGYTYAYRTRRARSGPQEAAFSYLGPLPEWTVAIAERFLQQGITALPFDQLIVNEYEPGQGIGAHIDDVVGFGEPIVSLSLLSSCVMDLMHPMHGRVPILLEPRSVLVLSGVARTKWSHGIAKRKTDPWLDRTLSRSRRLSMTFRRVVAQPPSRARSKSLRENPRQVTRRRRL